MVKSLKSLLIGAAGGALIMASNMFADTEIADGPGPYFAKIINGQDTLLARGVPNSYDPVLNRRLANFDGTEYEVLSNDTINTRSGKKVAVNVVDPLSTWINFIGMLPASQIPPTPKKEITLSTFGKDTVFEGHTYNLVNNAPGAIITIDGDMEEDYLNTPTSYSNGMTDTLNFMYFGGGLIRARLTIPSSVNFPIGKTRLLYMKGVSDSVNFTGYDSTNQKVFLTTPKDTAVGKIKDTVNIGGENIIIQQGTNGTIYLDPIDTASKEANAANTFSTNNSKNYYVATNGDSLVVNSINGDTEIVSLESTNHSLAKKLSVTGNMVKVRQGETATFPNGAKITANKVFNNGNINYFNGTYGLPTQVKNEKFPVTNNMNIYNHASCAKLFNLEGQLLGELKNINNIDDEIARKIMNSPKGLYLIKYPDGNTSKYIKAK